MLLKQTGHGELVHNLILTEMLNNQSTLVASYGTKTVRKQAELAALEKSLKTAVVVPIFVLSDLHIHHERDPSTTAKAAEKKLMEKKSGIKQQLSKSPVDEEDLLLPVQPLLNKVAISPSNTPDIVLLRPFFSFPPSPTPSLPITLPHSHPYPHPLTPSPTPSHPHPHTLSTIRTLLLRLLQTHDQP